MSQNWSETAGCCQFLQDEPVLVKTAGCTSSGASCRMYKIWRNLQTVTSSGVTLRNGTSLSNFGPDQDFITRSGLSCSHQVFPAVWDRSTHELARSLLVMILPFQERLLLMSGPGPSLKGAQLNPDHLGNFKSYYSDIMTIASQLCRMIDETDSIAPQLMQPAPTPNFQRPPKRPNEEILAPSPEKKNKRKDSFAIH
ncbi:hypothetical protein C8J56DRAFT_908107 [Mycena floridula]|nr:hypothetical protein C8J56DRAFT_908107 [Mycena floridula]